MMRTKVGVILSILVAACWAPWAHGGLIDIANPEPWGNPQLTTCLGGDSTQLAQAVIGVNKKNQNCNPFRSGGGNSTPFCLGSGDATNTCCQPEGGNDYGLMLLVAREVNDHGAYFCPTTIYGDKYSGDRSKDSDTTYRWRSYTLYGDSSNGSGCFWACMPGYGGDKCAQTQGFGCDTVPITRDAYDSYGMTRTPEIENQIPMFVKNHYAACNSSLCRGSHEKHFNQEHDIILAVTGWLTSGHGVHVRPVTIRAKWLYADGTKSNWVAEAKDATRVAVQAYLAGGQSQLLCKTGYTRNSDNTDCIEVDAQACNMQNLCPGFTEDGFDPETMIMEKGADRNCYMYTCKDPEMAFASGASFECTACVENMRNGVSPADGTCVTCEVGQVFDKNAKSTGYCTSATAYTKTDMQYGAGKTRATSGDLDTQCWTISDIDQYKACVANGGATSLASGTLSRALPATAVQYKFAQTETKLDLSAPTTVQTSVYATPANQTSLTVPAVSQQLQQAVSAVN